MKQVFKNIVVGILTLEAKMLLRRTKPVIVAITGSVGKTSVKDAVYTVLKEKISVRKTQKSFNSEFGVPLTILGLPTAWSNPVKWLKNLTDGLFLALHPTDYPDVLVLEMGVDRPGDMDKLTAWIKPDIVILTRLPDVPVHVEYFDSPEAVIEEKKKLVYALKPDGILVYNQDDSKVVEVAQGVVQKTIGYSRYSLSEFTASSDKVVYEDGKALGLEFTLTHGKTSTIMRINGSLGIQHAYNFAAATAVASIFEIGVKDAMLALADHEPPPGRMRLIHGIKDTLIIDDTYNSSPIASEQSLQTLGELRGVKRRIAVLGDMLELGQFSVREHERIGSLVPKYADMLVTIGVRARGFSKGALGAGMNQKCILEFDNAMSAGRELQTFLKEGDVILVKGSQSIRAERFVEELMAEPERAEELLVRQGKEWKNIP